MHHPGMEHLVLNDGHRAAMRESAGRTVAKAKALGLEKNLPEFFAGLGNVQARKLAPAKAYTPEISEVDESSCYDPWLSLSVVSSGKVGPCCVFREGKADSLHHMTLKEAWMGPYMTDLRRQMLQGEPPEPCEACQGDFIRHNEGVSAALYRQNMDWSLTPGNLVGKAISSLQRHGVVGSFRRGKEWLDLRRAAGKGHDPRS